MNAPSAFAEAVAALRASAARDARTFRVLARRAARREKVLAELLTVAGRESKGEPMRSAEVARLLNIHPRSVARWCAAGRFGVEGAGWFRVGRGVRVTEAGLNVCRGTQTKVETKEPLRVLALARPTPADWRSIRAARRAKAAS